MGSKVLHALGLSENAPHAGLCCLSIVSVAQILPAVTREWMEKTDDLNDAPKALLQLIPQLVGKMAEKTPFEVSEHAAYGVLLGLLQSGYTIDEMLAASGDAREAAPMVPAATRVRQHPQVTTRALSPATAATSIPAEDELVLLLMQHLDAPTANTMAYILANSAKTTMELIEGVNGDLPRAIELAAIGAMSFPYECENCGARTSTQFTANRPSGSSQGFGVGMSPRGGRVGYSERQYTKQMAVCIRCHDKMMGFNSFELKNRNGCLIFLPFILLFGMP